MLTIPCAPNGQSHWRQRTALSGRDYILVFDWNQRDGHWTLSVRDQDDVAIKHGIKLVSSWSLIRGLTDSRRPPGELAITDTTGAGQDPGFADLGARCLLLYIEPGER